MQVSKVDVLELNDESLKSFGKTWPARRGRLLPRRAATVAGAQATAAPPS
jgi:hypothetical protein